MQPDDQTIAQSVWFNGINQAGLFTLHKPATPDFTFRSLTLDGHEYRLCPHASHPPFHQWIYLVIPHTLPEEPYVLASHAVFTLGPVDTTLLWTVTVNYLTAACTASGLSSAPRTFLFVFHR
jgi:hypothetical protein